MSALRPFWELLNDVDRAASKAKAIHQCEKKIEYAVAAIKGVNYRRVQNAVLNA